MSENEIMEQEIEAKRLDLEAKRYALDERKLNLEQRFIHKHLALVITSLISLSALLVSLAQVWVANISKDKELEVTSLQEIKRREMEELRQLQDWNIKLAAFISENRAMVFSDQEVERQRMRELIQATFPPTTANNVFNRLANISVNPEAKKTWKEGEALNSDRRSQLIRDMFSDDKDTRISATTRLFREWTSDPELVPMAVDFANNNRTNKSGVINTLVVLQFVDPKLLNANRDQLHPFLQAVKDNGQQTAELVEKIRARMD